MACVCMGPDAGGEGLEAELPVHNEFSRISRPRSVRRPECQVCYPCSAYWYPHVAVFTKKTAYMNMWSTSGVVLSLSVCWWAPIDLLGWRIVLSFIPDIAATSEQKSRVLDFCSEFSCVLLTLGSSTLKPFPQEEEIQKALRFLVPTCGRALRCGLLDVQAHRVKLTLQALSGHNIG